jgi:hypothetical protein
MTPTQSSTNPSILSLKAILERENNREYSIAEVERIARGLLNFYEVLTDRPVKTHPKPFIENVSARINTDTA